MSDPPKKRGRPKKDRPDNPVLPAQEAPLPPVMGLVCPCCGRAMVPRVVNTAGLQRTLLCRLCGGRIRATYGSNGRPAYVRVLL